MHPLTAADILRTWETGLAQPPLRRALTLLAAAWPEETPDALADLSIGQRNARLLHVREATFGPALACFASCPRCGETAELAFEVADITVDAMVDPGATVTVQHDGYEIEARIPTSRDVLAVAGFGDAGTIRQRLLDRCVVAARAGGQSAAGADLPEYVVSELARRLAEADAQAEIRLALECPACGQPWEEGFDILACFWAEIDAWANRLLHDVHDLAVAHGWREADILAMNPVRRRRYLEMVGA
jgi:uncharacterized protein (UPF0212 family)